LKLLSLDIETTPALSWHYSMFNVNFGLSQVERKPEMLMWASHWYGEPLSTTKAYWAEDPESLETLWHQLDEATHVMGYNSDRFDLPWINAEFKRLGVMDGKPYSPVKKIDLMKQVKRNFRNLSNKLAYTSTHLLGLEGKKDESALALWLEIYRSEDVAKEFRNLGETVAAERFEKKALAAKKRMERYCIQDVKLLPKMYKELLPWMTGINAGLYTGDLAACPNCGAGKLQKRGYAYTAASAYQRYQCTSCGTWSRGTKSVDVSLLRNI
jgi:hypothetical protein